MIKTSEPPPPSKKVQKFPGMYPTNFQTITHFSCKQCLQIHIIFIGNIVAKYFKPIFPTKTLCTIAFPQKCTSENFHDYLCQPPPPPLIDPRTPTSQLPLGIKQLGDPCALSTDDHT